MTNNLLDTKLLLKNNFSINITTYNNTFTSMEKF